ncbi:MAG TPA: PAS domain-containing protein [Anaeromyxobacteraceae bacterium]|nr:PAS domain-containing protein [Anaeromyxobacteraceae bacterium]
MSTAIIGTAFGVIGAVVHRMAGSLRAARAHIELHARRERALLDTLPDTLAYATGAGRVLALHAGRPDSLPAPVEELLGRDIYEFLPDEAIAPMRNAIARTLVTGVVQTFECDLPVPNRRRSVENRVVRAGPDEVLVVQRDVRSPRMADDERRLMASLLDNVSEAVVVIGLDHRVQTWSRGAERLFGWHAHEAMGELVYGLLQPRMTSGEFDAFVAHLAAAGRVTTTGRRLHKDGRRLWTRSRFVMLRDGQGRRGGILAVSREVAPMRLVGRASEAQHV